MQYYGNVYRPPSEARSLILQLTIGCSHNKCTFCSMYKGGPFILRPLEDVKRDLEEMALLYPHARRLFLADGDALCIKTDRLLAVLQYIQKLFPSLERVGIYARASDLLRKSEEELKALRAAGLGIVYLGGESGSDEILKAVQKGEDSESLKRAVIKSESLGLPVSMTFISGLGGKALSEDHALKTARLISACQPSFVGLLALMIEPQAPLYEEIQKGRFQELSPEETLAETRLLLENIKTEKDIVFRSNHASNWLSLKGTLPQGKARMIAELDRALSHPECMRPSWMRGL